MHWTVLWKWETTLFGKRVDIAPELVPVLKWVELTTNVFVSEQKSLRACRSRGERERVEGKTGKRHSGRETDG